jgi:predicted phosphohydrolase
LVSLALAISAGCGVGTNQSGNVGASATGDVTHPLTQRTDPTQSITQACAAKATPPTVDGAFTKRPYLQQMTDSSVHVDWIAAAQPAPSVIVTTPEGGAVATVSATGDDSVHADAGKRAWSAPVAGLTADTTYCYEIKAGDAVLGSAGFHTAPAAGQGKPIRFIAFGDSGTGSSDQIADYTQMKTVPFDLMLHTGDVGYGSGTATELQQYFFDMYADTLEDVPAFPASGNHEYDSADAAPFREAFDLPPNGGEGGVERWYSFDWGDAHFVALDTERTGAVEAKWLEADLAANKRPWTIVYAHKPPFSSGEHGNDSSFQTYFKPILEKYHVQLVLNGHDHDYERTKPQNGVTYVVTGGGGGGTRPVGSSSFTAFSDAVIHFVYVTIQGDSLTLHAIDGTGKEFDSVVIPRQA